MIPLTKWIYNLTSLSKVGGKKPQKKLLMNSGYISISSIFKITFQTFTFISPGFKKITNEILKFPQSILSNLLCRLKLNQVFKDLRYIKKCCTFPNKKVNYIHFIPSHTIDINAICKALGTSKSKQVFAGKSADFTFQF